MSQRVLLTGAGYGSLRTQLHSAFTECSPRAIGVAAAFMSAHGVTTLRDMLPPAHEHEVRLIAGTSLSFTHPNAIKLARDQDWVVRLGSNRAGIFHPKVIVGGDSFDADGVIINPSILYIGSANLTKQAYDQNTECGLLVTTNEIPTGAALSFRRLWQRASDLTPEALEQYTTSFTRRNQTRTSRDIQEGGIADVLTAGNVTSANIRHQPRPAIGAIELRDAETVWIGLESTTGNWTFQPEFPRAVGDEVLRMIRQRNVILHETGVGVRRRIVADVRVRCSDGRALPMTFTYYFHNAMRRLNVPNDVPNANWARENRRGIAVVSGLDDPQAELSLNIFRPGPNADEIVRRSFLLGTWDRTTSRAYGWF